MDYRRLSIAHPGRAGIGGGPSIPLVPVSTISPLNPLPSPWGVSSSESSSQFSGDASIGCDSVSTSQNASLRLNKVPTSVRLATELIKTTSTSTSGPEGSPVLFGSAPLNTTRSRDVMRTGKAPATPAATRNPTPEEDSASPEASEDLQLIGTPLSGSQRYGSSASRRNSDVDSFQLNRLLSRSPVRQRPSLPPPSAFETAVARSSMPPPVQRYSSFRASTVSDSPATETSSPAEILMPPPPSSAALQSTSLTTDGYLSADPSRMTTQKLRVSSVPGLGTGWTEGHSDLRLGRVTSISGDRPSRSDHARQLSGHTIDLDRSGDSDASRHANMIVQSRKAKMQRWRPGYPSQGPGTLTPETTFSYPMGRKGSNAAAAMSATDLFASHWTEDAASSKLHGEHTGHLSGAQLGRTSTLPSDSYPGMTLEVHNDQIATAGAVSPAQLAAAMSIAMEREPSASGPVAGVEWVDWFDEYKSLKEAKIRAQAVADAKVNNGKDSSALETDPSTSQFKSEVIPFPSSQNTSNTDSPASRTRPPSPDDTPKPIRPRSQSMLSVDQPHSSPPTYRKMPGLLGERQRQASYASSFKSINSSTTGSQPQSQKKRKNLAKKMEGWWSAVKSNFGPMQGPNQSPYQGHLGSQSHGSKPERWSKDRSPAKTPSAPSSRRGSIIGSNRSGSPVSRKRPSQMIRAITSHADLKSSRADGDKPQLAPSALIHDTRAEGTTMSRPSTLPVEEFSNANLLARARTPSGLETRRNQPPLSLKLEPQGLHMPHRLQQLHRARIPAEGRSSMSGPSTTSSRPQDSGSSRTSSYNQGNSVITPGDLETPSPLNMLNADTKALSEGEQKDATTSAELAQASARQHVARRLAAAKNACDEHLGRIIGDIAFFVETHLHQAQAGQTPMDDESDALNDLVLHPWSAEQTEDDQESDSDGRQLGRCECELWPNGSTANTPLINPPALAKSIPLPRKDLSISRRSSISLATSPVKRKDLLNRSLGPTSPGRRLSTALARTARSQETGYHLRRPFESSRDRKNHSAGSSRSTSRSRSPMPGQISLPYAASSTTAEAAASMDGLLPVLQDIITLATDIQEISVNTLIAKPATCRDFVAKARRLGANWDDHPLWPGREWFVRLLLAVASLSRVVEWWEAESIFWNFVDEEQAHEPLTFVMKPLRETGSAEVSRHVSASAASRLPRAADWLRSPPSSHSETMSPGFGASGTELFPQAVTQVSTPRIPPLDDLQMQAEHAKSVNIVLELSLGGEIIEWVNPAWEEVLG